MANKRVERRMEWHLYEMMARHKIRTAVELQQRLERVGIKVTRAHLARLVVNNPKRLSSELMYGLTQVFGCSTDALWSNPNISELNSQGARPERNLPDADHNGSVERIKPKKRSSVPGDLNLTEEVCPPATAFKNPAADK